MLVPRVHFHGILQALGVAALPLVCLCALSCHKREAAGKSAPPAPEVDRILDEWDRMYDVYLKADAKQARASQVTSAEMIENSSIPGHMKAHAMYFTCTRLYYLDRTVGNHEAAEVDLIKARYWDVREGELGRAPLSQIVGADKVFNGDQYVTLVEHFARRNNGGRLPHFAEALATRPTTAKATN